MGHHFIVGFDVEPNEPMRCREAIQSMMRARVFVGVDRKLLAKGQLDNRLITPTPEQRRNRCEDDRYLFGEGPNHRTILLEPRSKIESESWERVKLLSSIANSSLGKRSCVRILVCGRTWRTQRLAFQHPGTSEIES